TRFEEAIRRRHDLRSALLEERLLLLRLRLAGEHRRDQQNHQNGPHSPNLNEAGRGRQPIKKSIAALNNRRARVECYFGPDIQPIATASTTLAGIGVGTIRSNRNPVFSSSRRYSSALRCRPSQVAVIMCTSTIGPGISLFACSTTISTNNNRFP